MRWEESLCLFRFFLSTRGDGPWVQRRLCTWGVAAEKVCLSMQSSKPLPPHHFFNPPRARERLLTLPHRNVTRSRFCPQSSTTATRSAPPRGSRTRAASPPTRSFSSYRSFPSSPPSRPFSPSRATRAPAPSRARRPRFPPSRSRAACAPTRSRTTSTSARPASDRKSVV